MLRTKAGTATRLVEKNLVNHATYRPDRFILLLAIAASISVADVSDGSPAKVIAKWATPNIIFGDYNTTNGTATKLIFRVNNADQAFLDASGKLGLGISTPGAKLEVKAASDATGGGIALKGSDGIGIIFDAYGSSSAGIRSGNLDLKASTAANYIHLTASGKSYFNGGNVGIRSTNPNSPLEILALTDANAGALTIKGSDNIATIIDAYGNNSAGVRYGVLDLLSALTTTPRIKLNANGNSYFNGGSVGIGSTGPVSALNVSTSGALQLVLTNSAAALNQKHRYIHSNNGNMYFGTLTDALVGTDQMMLSNSGRLGIGTTIPGATLEVNGNAKIVDALSAMCGISVVGRAQMPTVLMSSGPQIPNASLASKWNLNPTTAGAVGNMPFITANGNNGSGFGLIEADNVSSPVVWMYDYGGRNAFTVAKKGYQDGVGGDPSTIDTKLTPLFQVRENGNVGIGITNPSKRLDVNGDANISGALTVASISTKVWSIAPDYVFEDKYKLASLEKVESYVKENKHLPEVPSAKEIKDKGMDLAQMNLVLLKKVEELTLHAIRQEKELKRQAVEIRQLKAQSR